MHGKILVWPVCYLSYMLEPYPILLGNSPTRDLQIVDFVWQSGLPMVTKNNSKWYDLQTNCRVLHYGMILTWEKIEQQLSLPAQSKDRSMLLHVS